MSRHVTSYPVMSRHVTSCYVMSRYVTPRHVTSRHVMSRHVMPCYVVSRRVMSCYVMSRHVTSYHVMSHHVVSCHVTSRRVTSWHVVSSRVTSRHHVSRRVTSCHGMAHHGIRSKIPDGHTNNSLLPTDSFHANSTGLNVFVVHLVFELLLSYARSILYAKTFIPQPLFHYAIILSPLFFTNVSAPICFELRTHLPVE